MSRTFLNRCLGVLAHESSQANKLVKDSTMCSATGGRQRLRRRITVSPLPRPTQDGTFATEEHKIEERKEWKQDNWPVTQQTTSMTDAWGQVEAEHRQAGESPAGGSPSTSQRRSSGRATSKQYRVQDRDGFAQERGYQHSIGRTARPIERAVDTRSERRLPQREARNSEADARWFDIPSGAYEHTKLGRQRSPSRERPPRMVGHKERVKIILESNEALAKAAEVFEQEAQRHSKSSSALQRALQKFLGQTAGVFHVNGEWSDAVNLATAFRQLGAALETVRPSPAVLPAARELLQQLVDLALDREGSFKIGAVLQTVGALAKMSMLGSNSPMPPPGTRQAEAMTLLLEGLAMRAFRRFREPPMVDPREVALTMWGFSKLGMDPLDGMLFDAALKALGPQLSVTQFQNLNNVMIAAATLDKKLPETFLIQIAEQTILKMPQANAQGVANMLWAFGKLGAKTHLTGDLFRSALSRALEIKDELEAIHASNILWAVVAMEQPISPRTLEGLAAAAVRTMDSASPSTVAGLLAAARKLEVQPLEGRLVLAALEQGDRLLEQCNRFTLTNILWGATTATNDIPTSLRQRLEGPWAQRAVKLLSQTSDGEHWAQNMALILLSYSRLRLDPLQGRFFEQVLRLLEGRTELLTAQNAANILLATAQLRCKTVSKTVLQEVIDRVAAEGNSQEVSNTMWSVAVLGALDAKVMAALVQRLQDLEFGKDMTPPHANQLLMAHLSLKLLSKESVEGLLPPDIEEAARECCAQNKTIVVSNFHEEVSATLQQLGVSHAIEFASPDGLLSIDIVARCDDGQPLAIEVDGELHFTALPPYRPLGSTVLRNQLIAASGFRGLGIPFYDWERLKEDEERKKYLTARLAKWGIAPADAVAASS